MFILRKKRLNLLMKNIVIEFKKIWNTIFLAYQYSGEVFAENSVKIFIHITMDMFQRIKILYKIQAVVPRNKGNDSK